MITCITIMIFPGYSFAQTNTEDKSNAKKIAFKNMVDSQHFVFVAQSASPLRGSFVTSLLNMMLLSQTIPW